jgi:predicted nucleotide-binding protein (sugar kinase/HSP70/actin superfamily)
MKLSERKVTFPIMGRKNSKLIRNFLQDLGLEVIMPPPITDKTIKIGTKHCANMMCYPFKVTLGNYVEALEKGANTLFAYDNTGGRCRFGHYNHLHNFILKDLGYNYEMHTINKKNILKKLSEISGKNRLEIYRKLIKHYKYLKHNDSDSQKWVNDRPNIGIIGETYCCCEDKINFELEKKIEEFGANAYNTSTTSDFMESTIPLFNLFGLKTLFKKDEKKALKKEAQNYLRGFIVGHCFENIYNLLWLKNKGVDGIVHILPLSCMPETTIEPYVDKICRDAGIHLLRIPIDENSAEANLVTRIETFIELIKMKKKK